MENKVKQETVDDTKDKTEKEQFKFFFFLFWWNDDLKDKAEYIL